MFQGREYRVDLAYDSVLNVQRMFREKLLDEAEMLVESLKILGVAETDIRKLSWPERSGLLEQICTEKIAARPRPRVGRQQKLFDFEDDGEYIYASFLQDYGIDLVEQQGRLSWQRFAALFQGLSDKTKIKDVMRIRGMEMPMSNRNNQKEIRNLSELKSYYALGYREDNGKEGLDRLFSTLEGMAQ